jgi:hypothetical protein
VSFRIHFLPFLVIPQRRCIFFAPSNVIHDRGFLFAAAAAVGGSVVVDLDWFTPEALRMTPIDTLRARRR